MNERAIRSFPLFSEKIGVDGKSYREYRCAEDDEIIYPVLIGIQRAEHRAEEVIVIFAERLPPVQPPHDASPCDKPGTGRVDAELVQEEEEKPDDPRIPRYLSVQYVKFHKYGDEPHREGGDEPYHEVHPGHHRIPAAPVFRAINACLFHIPIISPKTKTPKPKRPGSSMSLITDIAASLRLLCLTTASFGSEQQYLLSYGIDALFLLCLSLCVSLIERAFVGVAAAQHLPDDAVMHQVQGLELALPPQYLGMP